MAIEFGALWVVNCRAKTLVRVDLATNRVVTEIATGVADPSGELSVATGAGSVWLLSDSSGVLSRIDPATNKVIARITVQPHSFAAVFGFGAVWISTTGRKGAVGAGSVQRIDPATNRVIATINVGPTPRFLAAGEGGVWTLNQGDGTVSRIDPATNSLVATIETGVPGGGGDIATGAGRVWVRAKTIMLQVIDPKRNVVIERYGPVAGSGAVRANERNVWVTAHDIHTVWVLPPRD
jgi:YVTN family beta-propeller protein